LCNWFWFMSPDCGDNSVCGAEIQGQCGPCHGSFITPSGWDSWNGPPCNLECKAACGAHSSWDRNITIARAAGRCGCTCSGGYTTSNGGHIFYTSRETFGCLAPAYVVSGAKYSQYNGRYTRVANHECNDYPVYQLGGKDGVVLVRTDWAWMVGSSEHAPPHCEDKGWVTRTCRSHVGSTRPDDAGCAGSWKE
jgi:hypothetical protein